MASRHGARLGKFGAHLGFGTLVTGLKAVRARSGETESARSKSVEAVDPIERVSSSDQIVREIIRGLYQGRFVPGQKLTEAELTRRFGVGRGTVREALKRLAADGIVVVSLHRGANIRTLTREEARNTLEVIEALAALSAKLAAERLSSPSDVKLLQDANAALTAAKSDPNSFEFGRLRDRFYRQLAQISGNGELSQLMPTVQAHLLRVQFRAAYGLEAERQRAKDYSLIVSAVLAKDGAKAERAMRQHIRRTRNLIDSLADNVFGF